MRRQCKVGSALCTHYKRVLTVWGFEEVDRQAAEIIPIGPARKKEISRVARKAEAAFFKSRHAFVEHLTNCVVCSRHLAMP
jgi:hypothetical protein